jgi:2-amino-4-hydroxy-6-hydroxymethyldihydropteridine diphosphokinase
LGDALGDLRASRFHDTAPVDVRPQPRFLNAVAVGRLAPEVSPMHLLQTLLAIEQERGRTRPFAGAPRTLDLDLILIDDLVLDTPSLCLPHPHFRARRFVLEPLVEVAPDVVDPVTGLTARQLLDALT